MLLLSIDAARVSAAGVESQGLRRRAVSLQDAWRLYDALVGDPRVTFSEEPVGLEPLWRNYTQGEAFSPKIWNDAYLVAFARAAPYELVTFDKGFKVYQDVTCSILG